jgi:hypothetical protein
VRTQTFALVGGILCAAVLAFVAMHIFVAGEAKLPTDILFQATVRGFPAYAMGVAWLAGAAAVLCASFIPVSLRHNELRTSRNIAFVVLGAAFLLAVAMDTFG